MQNPDGVVSENFIVEALPRDILRSVLKKLPSSHRFVAPVCREFRDLYGAVVGKKRTNKTYKYSISSQSALELYLNETKYYDKGRTRREEQARIGAGAGRIEWLERAGTWDRYKFPSGQRAS
mmetsp:Transcript_24668/g.49079  ORF Transcript_24668/g.49079 Transcript_24668/m.49079 type:complete len:122 (-) Transcript_24668:12-377(-)